MDFKERLAADPLGAVAACCIWIPIAAWVVTMIGWLITGEVETLTGICAIGLGLGMGIVAAFPPHPSLSPFLLLAAVATVVFTPLVRASYNRRALAAIDIEQLEKHYEALRLKPDNYGAMIKVAEMLFLRGLPGQAIALGDRALKALPANLFRAEHQMVNAWRLRSQDPNLFKPVACLRCGTLNQPGDLECAQCSFPHVIEMARGKWLGKGTVGQLIAVWVGLVLAFVGIPASAMLASRSLVLSVVLIIACVAIGLWFLLHTFLGGAREAA